jgi:SIR2-like protein
VTTRAVVDIARRVLTLAEETPLGTPPQVTPVMVDDLRQARDILDPALRQIGATVVDIGTIAERGCSGTVDDAALEAVVRGALEHPAAHGTRTVEFGSDENHRRRAFWGGEIDAGVTSPPDHALLGLATATIDERLRTPGDLVVVFYDEAQLEPFERPFAWQYATKVMPGYIAAQVRHVVVVLAAERPDEYHLSGNPSLRWSVDGKEVVQRNLASTNGNLTQRLIDDQDSHLVLFLAAGFSACMDMPLGNSMRDFALRQLLPDSTRVPDGELPRQFYVLMADQGNLLEFEQGQTNEELARQLTFERVLREELSAFDPSPTLAELERLEAAALAAEPVFAVRHLKSMLSGTRKLILVTVNFDRLIEHDEDERIEVFADDDRFAGCVAYIDRYLDGEPDAERVPLLKLHGSFSEQASLIASIEQTLIGLTSDKADALDRACSPRGDGRVPFVYVGSSMRDIDITLQLSQPRYATQLDERWVMPLPSSSVAEFVHRHRVATWHHRGVSASLEERLVSWTATEFLERLAATWS